jgi:hypothetical protein
MKQIFTLFFLLTGLLSLAQDKTIQVLQTEGGKKLNQQAPDSAKNWKIGGAVTLTASQGNLSNWAAGGDEYSLSINAYLNIHAFYKKGKHSWDNNLDYYFGYVNTTSLGARKNDDRIDLLSKYGYQLSKTLYLSYLFNFRTQLLDGFTYPDGVETFSSTFMAPAYLINSIGLDWKPAPNFSLFVSPFTSRLVIVNDDSLSAKGLYGVIPGKTTNHEFGAFATANYTANITKTLSYKGRLDLFSNYRNNAKNVDLNMTNLFAVKISKVLSATWSLDFIYDDDVRLFGPNKTSAGLQLKSLVGAGLLVKF